MCPFLSVTIVMVVNFPLQFHCFRSLKTVFVIDLSQSCFWQVFLPVPLRQIISKSFILHTYDRTKQKLIPFHAMIQNATFQTEVKLYLYWQICLWKYIGIIWLLQGVIQLLRGQNFAIFDPPPPPVWTQNLGEVWLPPPHHGSSGPDNYEFLPAWHLWEEISCAKASKTTRKSMFFILDVE